MAVTIDRVKQSSQSDEHEASEFEALFQEHWNRVYSALFRLVGDHAEAEDLALETFWRLYRNPPRQRDNLGGWLYRVALNLGYNALRAFKRRKRYEQVSGYDTLRHVHSADPAQEVEEEERRRGVRMALSRMRPRSAQLLILRYSGLSYAEVAAAMGVSPGSVGTLLARAEREFEVCYQAFSDPHG